MKLTIFINTHENWIEILSAPPYNIKIIAEGNYYILKYNQFSSDFNEELVREARGCIFYRDITNYYHCVCHPFDKFGNYGESYVPEIDWATAKVYEKVDGSLIKFWWWEGEWHISTNGTIDARNAVCPDGKHTYYDLVEMAITNRDITLVDFCEDYLNIAYCYMFELVSPLNRMTIKYDEHMLYFLSARNMITDKEELSMGAPLVGLVEYPAYYNLHTIDQCLLATSKMGADEEGFVVCDNRNNRMKIKSEQYLIASHLRANNNITTKKIIQMIKDGTIDDFCAYCGDYKEQVDKVKSIISLIVNGIEVTWQSCNAMRIPTKKEFYMVARHFRYSDYFLKKYDGHAITAEEWFFKLPIDTAVKWVEAFLT